jgi:hypothetical protein
MEPPTPYSQVVDNASSRHFFSERGEWKKSNNRLTHSALITRLSDPWGGEEYGGSSSRQPPLCAVCVGHI